MSEQKANQDKQQNSPTGQLEANRAAIADKPAYVIRREIKSALIDSLLVMVRDEEAADANKIKAIQTLARITGLDKAGGPVRRRAKRASNVTKGNDFQPPADRLDQLTGALQ